MAYFPVRRSLFNSSKYFPALPLPLGVLLLAGVALLAGCHPAVTDPKDPKFIVAEKGTWQITRADLDKEIANILKQHQATPEQVGPSKMPIVETQILKNMVLEKLVLDRAAALPLKDVDKEEAAQLDTAKQSVPPGQTFDQMLKTAGLSLDDVKKIIHEKVVTHKVLEAEAFKDVDPTEPEINEFYLQHKAEITAPPQVRASRILVHVDEKATVAEKGAKKKIITKARDRVVHGEDFGKVAAEVSEDRSSAPNRGDLGFFQRGENPDAGFDEVAFGTKQGTVSPVFETPLGYQFLKVTDTKPGGEVPLADVRPKITAFMRDQKMKQQSQAYVMKLLADSGVTYHVVLVDPPAQGMPPAGPGAPPPQQAPPAPAASAPAK